MATKRIRIHALRIGAEVSDARRLRQTMLRSVHSVLECIRTTGDVPVQEVQQIPEKMLARILEQEGGFNGFTDRAIFTFINGRHRIHDHEKCK